MNNLLNHTISELHQQLVDKKLTVEEIVDASTLAIKKSNGQLNALISLMEDQQLEKQIGKAQSMIDAGIATALTGIPYVLKDSYVTKELPTTAASTLLDGYTAPYNATVYQKLHDAGAILVGKANMDAWGHGATNENTDFGSVKNPWDNSRVAGGSSGGCAVAVSAGMACFSIGEDTGGSIRNPAAWNNVTGLKVTYGRVSRYGCIAYASSFDTVGPMAKTAEDCALVLETIAGHDPLDGSSSPEKVDTYSQSLSQDKKLTIGIPEELFSDVLRYDVKQGLENAITTFRNLGYETKTISMPVLEYALSVYYLIGLSETSSNLARYDGVRYGKTRDAFRPENKRRIMIGSYALSAGYYDAYYKKALQARTLLINAYNTAFDQVDVLLQPVTTSVATKIGESIEDPLENIMIDLFTTSQNPAGIPSLAVPAGFNKENLPFGMQIVGPKFSESTLLALGHAYQQQTNWHQQVPTIK